MVVVSDTSPITNLIQIGRLDLLRQLFASVLIPSAVYGELCEIDWQKGVLDGQAWISIRVPLHAENVRRFDGDLDLGEAEAIALALEVHPDFLLMDEQRGRHRADELGLPVVGLLGVLMRAKNAGLIQAVEPVMEELVTQAGFRIHPTLYRDVLTQVGER